MSLAAFAAHRQLHSTPASDSASLHYPSAGSKDYCLATLFVEAPEVEKGSRYLRVSSFSRRWVRLTAMAGFRYSGDAVAVSREVYRVLVSVGYARTGRVITYGKLAAKVGRHHRALSIRFTRLRMSALPVGRRALRRWWSTSGRACQTLGVLLIRAGSWGWRCVILRPRSGRLRRGGESEPARRTDPAAF